HPAPQPGRGQGAGGRPAHGHRHSRRRGNRLVHAQRCQGDGHCRRHRQPRAGQDGRRGAVERRPAVGLQPPGEGVDRRRADVRCAGSQAAAGQRLRARPAGRGRRQVRRAALLAAALSAWLVTPVAAQDFAIVGATVALGDGSEPIENGTVLVRDGRIAAAGAGVPIPAGIETIDGRGRWVTPGLFASLTDLGLWDVEAVEESNDTAADKSPFGAALDVTPAINPQSEHVKVSRAGGVTRASVAGFPGGSIFAGQGALIDLGADRDAVMQPRAFQFVTLAEQGGAIAGGSRGAAHALFRNALREAKSFDERGALAARRAGTRGDMPLDLRPIDPRMTGSTADRGDDVLLTRFDAAALIPVVNGDQPLYVEAHRASDILAVLALRDEFPQLKLVLVGATEGWLVAQEIAAARVP